MSYQKLVLPLLLAVVFLAAIAYGFYAQRSNLMATKAELSDSRLRTATLEKELEESRYETVTLADALESERSKNAVFEERIQSIGATVGKLDKLSKTDPELLAKYSRVYFLNENYRPTALETMDTAYQYNPAREIWLHTEVKPHLYALLEEAKQDGINLTVLSGYRSFETQSDLKEQYLYRYGSGANAFSADQGYSEHQLGTTFDFTTSSVGDTFVDFERTPAYAWLLDNAHRFGFTLSYPEDNEHYQFEPWHWRFVSVELATRLYRNGESLYDLDQRTIDEYLIDFFE